MSWIDDYNKAADKPAWLKQNAASVPYNELLDFSYGNHKLPANSTIITRPFSLELTKADVENLFNSNQLYEFYIAFEESGSSLSPHTEVNFTLTYFCFSIPLFTSIFQTHNLGATAKIHFERALVNGIESVIISVDDGSTVFQFDITHDPT